ncbi:hypothetical protein GN241_13055 [Rhodobacteraceae bacterium IMCC1335]
MKYVYTSNFGGYDSFLSGNVSSFEGLSFVYFHNNPSKFFSENLSKHGWIGQYIDLEKQNAAVLNRSVKFHPWKYLPSNLTESIYIDSNVTVISSPEVIFEEFSDVDVGFYRHWARETFIEEFLECARAGHFFLPFALNLLNYVAVDYKITRLPECNLIYMKNNSLSKAFSMSWWTKYLQGPKRDQLHVKSALAESNVTHFISPVNEQRIRNLCFSTSGTHDGKQLKLKQRFIRQLNKAFL